MARSARPDFGEKKPFKFTIDVDDAFSFLDDFKQSPNYPKTGAELGLNFPYTPNKYQILGDMLRGMFGVDTVEARKIVGMWFERNNRLRTESKRKIITLTESDLLRIVKKVQRESKQLNEWDDPDLITSLGGLAAAGILYLSVDAAERLWGWILEKNEARKKITFLKERYGWIFKGDQEFKDLLEKYRVLRDEYRSEIKNIEDEANQDPFNEKTPLQKHFGAMSKSKTWKGLDAVSTELENYMKKRISDEFGSEEIDGFGNTFKLRSLRDAVLDNKIKI